MAYRIKDGRLQKLEFLTTGLKNKCGNAVVRDMWVDLGPASQPCEEIARVESKQVN